MSFKISQTSVSNPSVSAVPSFNATFNFFSRCMSLALLLFFSLETERHTYFSVVEAKRRLSYSLPAGMSWVQRDTFVRVGVVVVAHWFGGGILSTSRWTSKENSLVNGILPRVLHLGRRGTASCKERGGLAHGNVGAGAHQRFCCRGSNDLGCNLFIYLFWTICGTKALVSIKAAMFDYGGSYVGKFPHLLQGRAPRVPLYWIIHGQPYLPIV